jgi:hypothetical protein
MKRPLLLLLGSVLLILGTVVPGGSLMMAAGLALLICASPWFRQCVRLLRKRFGWIDGGMVALEGVVGQRLGSILRGTNPDDGTKTP